jgi:hypothetical protein
MKPYSGSSKPRSSAIHGVLEKCFNDGVNEA